MRPVRIMAGTVAMLSLLLAACGGGGGGSASPPAPAPDPLSFYVAPAQVALTSSDVRTIVGQAVAEAQSRALPAVIAVTDRVGNVLAVYKMPGARDTMTTRAAPNGANADAQGLAVPAAAGAIAKAVTGAYLSSSGNAFSTRTASMIVQAHFPPGATSTSLPAGPLFGVQFSQLPCSDLATRFGVGSAMIGPKRSPLGLAADPGGFPLYKDGVVVGGVGAMADGDYGFDADSYDRDTDAEEIIALAATRGFAPDATIRADRISAGALLRYADADMDAVQSGAPASLSDANLLSVTGYYDAAALYRAGAAYGAEASGFRPASAAEFALRDAYVLTDGAGVNRYPVRAGTDPVASPLSASEVRAILEEAFTVMRRARAQIRQPVDSRAQVTISIVDSTGAVLGLVRSPDAPVFGTDVSVQKARTAAFFSSATAASALLADPSSDVRGFVTATRTFGGAPMLDGAVALSARAVGNLSRPHFPDGDTGQPHGPFSRPIAQFNPFSTGLQSALIVGNLAAHLGFVTGAVASDTGTCSSTPRLANGIQIFPGGVPVYRAGVLVGAIGVSGDGVGQDDMIAFLGTHKGGQRTIDIGNAGAAIRADILTPRGQRLMYVQCPFAPFLDTSAQDACGGL